MGSLPGVLDTRAAWIGKREIIQVQFDSKRLSYAKLLEFALGHSCDQWVYATSDAQLSTAKKMAGDKVERFKGKPRVAKISDQLYYLAKSPLRFLPLSPVQARRVNGALGTSQDPNLWLSPRQIALIPAVEKALAEDPSSLTPLTRPNQLDGLKSYEDLLRATFQSKKN